MLKRLIIGISVSVLVLACSNRTDLTSPDADGAKAAAEYFYSLLARGQGQAYVDNMHGAQEMDSCKYSQYVDLMEQFLHEEEELRGGILSAQAEHNTMQDTLSKVYLDVHFGDSTCEEIMLQVVYSRGRWWIR